MSSLLGHRQLSHVQPYREKNRKNIPRATETKERQEGERNSKYRHNRSQHRRQIQHSTVHLTNTATRREQETPISTSSSRSYTRQTTKLHSPNQHNHQKFLLLPDPVQRPCLQAKPQSLKKGLFRHMLKQGIAEDLMYPVPSQWLNIP